MDRPRVLIVSGFKIFPEYTGGHLHSGGIAKSLARLGFPTLIYSFAGRAEHYRPGGPNYLLEEIEPGLKEETNLGWTIGLTQTVFRRMGRPRSWQYELMRKGLIPQRMKKALSEADIIISDLPVCPVIPGPWASKPWFMISHNLEYELLEQGSATEKKYVGWMRRLEEQAPQTYTDIFACAEGDQRFFLEHDSSGKIKVPIITSGVDERAYVTNPELRAKTRAELGVKDDEHLLIFSGSKFGPNLDALVGTREFCASEADWLAEKRIRFLIAGSMVDQASTEGPLITTGRVPEMLPYFAAADAGLNPITRGSGANVKLFEYLAAHLPVISTRFGIRGTDLEAERDFIELDVLKPKIALTKFADRPASDWPEFTKRVWQRHRSRCEIVELVKAAIDQIPAFNGS